VTGSLTSYPRHSTTGRKSQCSFALSKISYFLDLVKPGTLGFPKRILKDTEREPFTRLSRENRDQYNSQ